ncbi:hypothetical protein [Streptomyces sp. NPDC001930]|uniref:hypothetical protein n=1 Tax=Streptomyces sp. NPDC001930 TaxID=3364625 RepID=UPI003681CFE6
MLNILSDTLTDTTTPVGERRLPMPIKAVVIGLGVAVTLIVATMVGVAAGYLARRDQASIPSAIARGAAAFSATVTLVCVMTAALATL